MAESNPDGLLLTVPVHDIVAGALRALKELADLDIPDPRGIHDAGLGGLDRDEAYLLARLERVDGDEAQAEALLQAINDTAHLYG